MTTSPHWPCFWTAGLLIILNRLPPKWLSLPQDWSLSLDSAWYPGTELPCFIPTRLLWDGDLPLCTPPLHITHLIPLRVSSPGTWPLTEPGESGLLRSPWDNSDPSRTGHTMSKNVSCQLAIPQKWSLQMGQPPGHGVILLPGPQGLLLSSPWLSQVDDPLITASI